jgi:chromosome segregation ATPase
MDIETFEAIETLRADVRRVEVTLSEKIDRSVEASASTLRVEMGQVRTEMASMREEMSSMRDGMSSMRDELKRHSEVLFESLRDDIRMIAEGLVTLDRRVESLRRPADLQ